MKALIGGDYTNKFDTTFTRRMTSNKAQSGESLNDLKKALEIVIADIEKDPTSKDRYSNPLPYYQARLKKCIENQKFHAIFQQFPIEEQKAWMIGEFKNICAHLPQSIVELLPGCLYPGDCGRPITEKPDWLDMEKFRKGQQFHRDNYAMMWLGITYGLCMLLNIDEGLKPLVMNNRVNIPFTAFSRYLTIMKRMDAIFTGDPWTEGTEAYKEVQNIRRKHLIVRRDLEKYDNETLYNASILKNPHAPTHDVIRKDVEASCPIPLQGQCPFDFWAYADSGKPKSLNQITMSLTQHAFMGLVVTQPEKLSIYNATDENLEAFCHMWRCIGHSLGIQDEFNFCQGSLEEIKKRVQDVNEYWVKPSFLNYNKDVEHVNRSMCNGINYYLPVLNYETIVLQQSELLNIQMPNLYASLSYPTRLFHALFNFSIRHLITISFIRKVLNTSFRYFKTRALTLDSKKLAELKEKSEKSPLHTSVYKPLITTQ